VIYVGIDDTDTLDSRGTNQLAKHMARRLAGRYFCHRIVRHQLLDDPRVPYTSKNGSASLLFEYQGDAAPPAISSFADELAQMMLDNFIPGSDPGLCVTTTVAQPVIEFGRVCQREVVNKKMALQIAASAGVFLKDLGGTGDGIVGALAAVGIAASNDGGRIVQWRDWPDDLSGDQAVETLLQRDVGLREFETQQTVTTGRVDVGKHLRPNWVNGQCVLFVTRQPSQPNYWKALKRL